MSIKQFRNVPDVVSGYELDENDKWFGVIIPSASTNWMYDSSVERYLDEYTEYNASMQIAHDFSLFGMSCMEIYPNDDNDAGIYVETFLFPGSWVFSVYVNEKIDTYHTFRLYVTDSTGTTILSNVIELKSSGRWQRIEVPFEVDSYDTYRYYLIRAANTEGGGFYADGFQLEYSYDASRRVASTYFNGDMEGFLPGVKEYGWDGDRLLSSSYRMPSARSGGDIVLLNDIGFHLMGVVGLGYPSPKHQMTELAEGGADYQDTIFGPRTFSLVGSIMGETYQDLSRVRSELIDSFRIDKGGTKQALYLTYQTSAGRERNELPAKIKCYYTGGLEGAINNLIQERIALTFQQPEAIIEKDDYSEITDLEINSYLNQMLLAYDQNVITRSDGAFEAFGTWNPTGCIISRIKPHPINPRQVIICGNMNWGVLGSGNEYIVILDLDTGDVESIVGLGNIIINVGNAIYDFDVEISTDEYGLEYIAAWYIVGDFSRVGNGAGVAAANIAKYDPIADTWLNYGAGTFGIVYAIAGGGTLIGGDFTVVNTVACNRIAKLNWNTFTVTTFGTGANGVVRDLLTDSVFYGNSNDTLFGDMCYLAGDFTTVNGNPSRAFAILDHVAGSWYDLDLFTGGTATRMKNIGSDVYICGLSLQYGSDYGVFKYNNDGMVCYIPLGSGVSVYDFAKDENDDTFYLAGRDFDLPWAILTGESPLIVAWSGSQTETMGAYHISDAGYGSAICVLPPTELNTSTLFYSITSGTAFYNYSSLVLTNYLNSVYVDDYVVVGMSLYIQGPGRFVSMKNYTVGQNFRCNILIKDGEDMVMIFGRNDLKVFHSTLGVLTSKISLIKFIRPYSDIGISLRQGLNDIAIDLYDSWEVVSDGAITEQDYVTGTKFLDGVNRFNSNNGYLYFQVIDAGGGNRRVRFYDDSACTSSVAQTGYLTSLPRWVNVSELNGSGISGWVYVTSDDLAEPVGVTSINIFPARIKIQKAYRTIDEIVW